MDSIPLDSRNRPASKQITVRHHTGMLSAITPESVSGMVRITQYVYNQAFLGFGGCFTVDSGFLPVSHA